MEPPASSLCSIPLERTRPPASLCIAGTTARFGTENRGEVAGVIQHLLCEFEDQLDSEVIFRVVLGRRAELTSCPHSALPERMSRLARRWLSAAAPADGSRSRPVA
jgi:hypothetical protein